MATQRKEPCSVKVIFVYAFSIWSFMLVGPTGSSQAVAGEKEPQTMVAWPENGLGLSIDLSGFKTNIDQVKPDGRRYLMASHPTTGLNVSVTLEKVPSQASIKGCVEHLQQLQKGPFVSRGQGIKLTAAGEMPTLEYTLREYQGVRLDQRNMYACLAQGNVYADIHLSKVHFTPADAPLFHAILKTTHLQPSSPQTIRAQTPTTQTSMQLFRLGSAFYLQNKYDQAIPPYQKALDLERAQPQLDKTLWRVLVDNLGMAYGMTGRLKEAKVTFEHGIQADPTYPMFHYNLACTFAEMNDLDHAMQSLKTAFQYRKNQNAGEEGMPDPRQDSSFQRFMNNDVFRTFVNNLTAVKS
jgi:tetratricopeptide (TPR) repeat protein